MLQYECASKQACTWSREPLPRDSQPAGRQTPRHPRLLRGRPPLLPGGLFLLAGTILKMGKNARFGTHRTNAFMWSRALLLRETQLQDWSLSLLAAR